MNCFPSRLHRGFFFFVLAAFLTVVGLGCAACKSDSGHTSDPKLKGIDELLAAKLPPGTPMSRVTIYLNSRGYTLAASPDPHSVVAIVQHINTETVQPEAAKVTFHFDANDKLTSYDLEPASTMPTQ